MGLTAILSTFMLHMKYYIHHVIGFIIILIGLFTYGILSNSVQSSNNSLELKHFICLLIYLVSSFFGNIEKYLMQVEYVSSYLVVAGEGFFGFLVSGILFLLLNENCPNGSNNNKSPFCFNTSIESKHYWSDFLLYFDNKELTIGLMVYLIGVFWFDTFKMKTNQSYTPTHRSIGDNLSGIIFWIMQLTIDWFHSDKKTTTPALVVFQGISYLMMSIGIMIFLELVIVNLCEMNRNTVDSINKRVDKENKTMNYLEAFDSEIFEESESNDTFEIQ